MYILANNFDRSSSPFLYRANPKTFTDRAGWQGWSSSGGWGKPPTPLFADRTGEMSIRQIDGKPVLSYFNATNGNMEMRVAYDPTGLGTAPVTTVVFAECLAGPGRHVAPPGGQPAGPALWRLHLTGIDAGSGAGLHQPVEHHGPRRHPYRVIQYAVNP